MPVPIKPPRLNTGHHRPGTTATEWKSRYQTSFYTSLNLYVQICITGVKEAMDNKKIVKNSVVSYFRKLGSGTDVLSQPQPQKWVVYILLECLYWNYATEQRIRNLPRPYTPRDVGFWRRRLIFTSASYCSKMYDKVSFFFFLSTFTEPKGRIEPGKSRRLCKRLRTL